ncbi:MAG: RNA polymerase-binding protein RbpA [Bifidobacteriaceae bacterium]|jgi:hypothetical protein|nr:RNA polymerase-binding protein RbpA [Bifidobacteriaceae bacterium]
MPDSSFHGMRIGGKSLEREEGVKWAERIDTYYDCPVNHVTLIPFSIEADIPQTWICRCGREAVKRDDDSDYDNPLGKNVRTHWDIVQERRSIKELKAGLKQRLELVRQGKLRVGV